MTSEQSYISAQEKSENKNLYLFKVGGFYHAVNGAAFALHRVTGYQVRKQHRKAGDNFLLGFPIAQIAEVKEKLKQCNMAFESFDPTENTIIFHGGNPTVDLSLVTEEIDEPQTEPINLLREPQPQGKPQGNKKKQQSTAMDIVIRLIRLDVANMTPMEAIAALAELKKLALAI
ncbi:MAG: hypothetical protein K5854_08325 [Prevotella sp.]|nr:hypothetical protein [Prevotella sp.]